MYRRLIGLLAGAALLLAACGPGAPSMTEGATTEPASAGELTPRPLEKVTSGLGYIPTVQFAPFYVAAAKGFYAEEGLEVEWSYGGNVNDLLLQSAAGGLAFVAAAGDEVLLARAQQVPVQMVFLLWQRAPIAVFGKQTAGIAEPEDLRGKTIGVPGRFGATYIGLLGLLDAAGLAESDVNIQEIGFTQFEAVSGDKVPVAVGYASNEPLRLQEAGVPVSVINVADHLQLVSNGIVVSEQYARENGETVRKFIRATRKGLEATLADPEDAFKLSVEFIPELTTEAQPFQRKVLEDTLGYWQTDETREHGLGWLNPPAWDATYRFLRESDILSQDLDPAEAYSEAFIE